MKRTRKTSWGKLFLALFTAFFLLPLAAADSTTTTTTPTQAIVGSLCAVVNLVKIIAGAIAILAFAILGVQFMTVGSNPMARDEIKTKMSYIVIGMLVILASNYIVAIFLPGAASCPFVPF